ncbi:hypothetical protein [Massilia horti]|uniref:Uncharacterized protein n=1 Tax=Massilia horti TaxID=2562153 RepID=A0A4Y9T5S6_9BURK|nr:hypothetical protein [Massilia horti]TFW32404.1 hypothetical protein E4O92_09915 [Massilia horti]
MDKDLLKGLALVIGAVIVVGAVFVIVSNSGPQKAKCVADALKSGVAYGKIDKVCRLSQRSY